MSIAASRPRGITSGPPPVERIDARGGGGSGWVTLVTAANDIEAHLLAGRLSEAGVEAQVMKDRSAPGAWLYGGSNPWAPALVLVRKLQLDDARIVLAEISFEAPAANRTLAALRRDWRTPVVWWSLALGLGVLMTGIGLSRTEAALRRCDLPLLCADASGDR